MNPRATGLGSPRNGMPEQKLYRWRGQPPPAPGRAAAERPKKSWTPAARRERLEALARMRVNDTNNRIDRLDRDTLTHQQAAWILGVTPRTILRDLRAMREAS